MKRQYVPFYFYCPYCELNLRNYEGYYEERIGYGFKDNFNERYETSEDFLVRYPIYGEDNIRAKKDMEKITKVIFEEISRDLKFLEGLPITKELMHFVIRVLADYINKNHVKFIDPIEMKIDGLMKALKKDLYWVFEILELFGVSPETAVSFVEKVVSIFLREIMPDKSKEEKSPMWGM